MAFDRPTISEILKRVKADLKGTLGIVNIIRRSFLDAFAKALTGAAHLLHGHLEKISEDIFSVSFWAETVFQIQKTPATFTQLLVKFTGTPGVTIPAETAVKRSDGVQYFTDEAAVIQTAVTGVAESTEITAVADVSGSLNNKYFNYDTPTKLFTFFCSVSGSGTDPNIGGRVSVIVPIVSGDTDVNNAAALQAAMDAQDEINASVVGAVVTATCVDTGDVEDPVDGSLATGFGFNVVTQGVTEVIGGEVDVQVTSEVFGATSNLDDGETVNLVSAISNVDSEATVVSTVTEGEEEESTEAYEERASDIIKNPPLGGSANDYIQQAKTVVGVTRAWVFPNHLGVGTVGVAFVQDDEPSIIPSAAKIAEVQAVIDAFAPVGLSSVTVFAPVAVPMNPVIKISPNNSTVQNAIKDELNDLLLRDANPKGSWAGPGSTYDGKILKSRIDEAISIAKGEEDHLVTSPSADVTLSSTGEIVTLGTVTWQSL